MKINARHFLEILDVMWSALVFLETEVPTESFVKSHELRKRLSKLSDYEIDAGEGDVEQSLEEILETLDWSEAVPEENKVWKGIFYDRNRLFMSWEELEEAYKSWYTKNEIIEIESKIRDEIRRKMNIKKKLVVAIKQPLLDILPQEKE